MNRCNPIGLVAAVLALAVLAPGASAAITQPPQPKSGPGGSDHSHAGWRVTSGGRAADAWYVFEPARPRPRRAPLSVVMHGYFEFSGYASLRALIRHTVRRGAVVIYPRWQTADSARCTGPFGFQPCMTSAVRGIRGALAYLRARPRRRVQPQTKTTSYFGLSFGAIITANLANRYRSLHLPKPRVIFLDDPEDLDGGGEPNLDDSLSGIPRDALVQCHSGADGALVLHPSAVGDASCNAVFPKLGQIPKKNKDLVLTHTDDHGRPALSAAHGVCATGFGKPDAYDWNFCWKVWDALRDCAFHGTRCEYALGDTRRHRSLGRWSDGTAVTPLTIQDAAPIWP